MKKVSIKNLNKINIKSLGKKQSNQIAGGAGGFGKQYPAGTATSSIEDPHPWQQSAFSRTLQPM